MARFYGLVGYTITTETSPGTWEPKNIEIPYSGEIPRNYVRNETRSSINDSTNISNTVTIVADPYAKEHVYDMQYVKFLYPKLGGTWKIEGIDINSYPRLSLSLGGLYHE